MSTFLKALLAIILIIIAALGGVYYYAFHAGDDTPLEQYVPSDSIAYIEIPNTRLTALDLATNPHAEGYAEIGRILGALVAGGTAGSRASIDFNALDQEALLKMALPLNRQVCIWMPPIDWTANKPKAQLPLMIAHFQGSESDFEANVNAFATSLGEALGVADSGTAWRWTSEDWQGQTLRSLAVKERQDSSETAPVQADLFRPAWTLWNGRLLASLSVDSLKGFLASLGEGMLPPTAGTKATDANYRKARAAPETDDFLMQLDIPSLLAGFEFFHEFFSRQQAAPTVEASLKTVLNDLGIHELGALTYGLDFTGEGLQALSSVTYGEDVGLWKTISSNADNPSPRFLPASVDASSSVSMDFGEFALLLKDMAVRANPMIGQMYAQQKTQIDQMLGMDAEEFVERVFSYEMHTLYEFGNAAAPMGAGPNPLAGLESQVFVFGLEEADLMENVLQQRIDPMAAMMPKLFEERVAGGISYRVFRNPEMPNSPSIGYAMTENYLVVGMGSSALGLFDETLALIDSGEAGLLQTSPIADAFDPNSDGLVGVSIIDTESYVEFAKSVAQTMVRASEASGDQQIAAALGAINWAALERFSAYAVTSSYKTSAELMAKTKVISK